MVIDSLSPFIPRTPPAEGLNPPIAMPDEQTPLLDTAKVVEGEMPTPPPSIPAPGPRSQDAVTVTSGSKPRHLPQAIAHRGYKAAAPENTMLAFRAAVEVGAHAVETDLHLSKDGVVVLSHDATLKRCFGFDAKVRDCDWSYLSTLRTLQEPAESLPRLKDLLEYLNEGALEHVWIMLDIKTDDDAAELMRKTAETIASVPGIRPWSERILPCCWTAEYVKLTQTLLPGFPIAHVGVNTAYARALADHVPELGLSILAHALATPVLGPRFLRDMRRAGHRVYSWTVNDEDWMRWAVRERLAGVITDDPKLFLDVCRRVCEEEDGTKEGGGVLALVRRRSSTVRARVAAAPGRLFFWIRYFVFQLILTVIYLVRWGLPSTQVPKVLGS
ncbi:PLC-like phosphodiesterase [Hypoxylon rubiginosum]|uniref:PLC-like phosphodiesterase n=1 Tax=Hypoxylon rubiginosum TaxID=110542 RepID=A0ACB9YWY4_9PEZI|nr:PLC-like phosphodiesterase [Hypoxylon rubiginosum]